MNHETPHALYMTPRIMVMKSGSFKHGGHVAYKVESNNKYPHYTKYLLSCQ